VTENAGATALGLFAIILMLGPVSGLHFPMVSRSGSIIGAGRRRRPLVSLVIKVGPVTMAPP